jgi:hypothetical protein
MLQLQIVNNVVRGGAQQHREKNLFFHGLMVLVSEKLQESDDSTDVEYFDSIPLFHDLNHPVENIQPSPEDCMILGNQFCTSHGSPSLSVSGQKKTPRNARFADSGTSWSVCQYNFVR